MPDEDRDRELPQRVRGTSRPGPASPSPPALSEEQRQRIRAAVMAERGETGGQDKKLATEPERRVTASGPADSSVTMPAANGVNRAIKPDHAAESGRAIKPIQATESERTVEPVKSKPTGAPVKSKLTGAPVKSKLTGAPVKSEPTGAPVKSEPATKAQPNGSAPAGRKPGGVLRADRPERPHASAQKRSARRRLVTTALVAAALAVIALGSLGIAVTRYVTTPRADSNSLTPLQRQEMAVSRHAAAWVAQHVSRSAVVSCDQVMCAELETDGIPAHDLLVLRSTSPYPVTSEVVVETAAVRNQFGFSLDNDYAPAVLATFGSGDAQITIRVIAPGGAAAYHNALGTDLTDQKAFAGAMLQLNGITVSARAREQLLADLVDSRLLLAIEALATSQPIDIVQFGNIGPGADPDIPLRFADLAESDHPAHVTSSAYARSIRADLGKAPAPADTGSVEAVPLPGGQTALRVQFPAPSPPWLLGPPKSH